MKKIIIIIVILLIILLGGYYMMKNGEKSNENEMQNTLINEIQKDTVHEIQYSSMDKIEEIMKENMDYILIDARTLEEYNEGHIPNAICIPNESIDESVVSKLPDKKQLLLVYCRSGNRSKQAAKKLNKLGYENIIEFGGIIDWKGEITK